MASVFLRIRRLHTGRHPTEADAQGACLHGTVRPIPGRRASNGGKVAFAAAVYPGIRRNGRCAVVVMHCRHHLASVARRVRDRTVEEDVHAGALGNHVEAAFDRLRICWRPYASRPQPGALPRRCVLSRNCRKTLSIRPASGSLLSESRFPELMKA